MKYVCISLLAIVVAAACVGLDYPIPTTIISKVRMDQRCLGTCIENLTINSNGAVRYYEKAGISMNSSRDFGIESREFSSLLRLYDTNFFILDDFYTCEDANTYTTIIFMFQNNTRNKTVIVGENCKLVPPLSLINSELDRIKNQKISYEDRSVFVFLNKTIIGDIKNRIDEAI